MRKNRTGAAGMVVGVLALMLPASPVGAQQFNSDNYLAMPRGMSTTTVTGGTEFSGLLVSGAVSWDLNPGVQLATDQWPA